jgi:CheY-like chemotaxis protein
MHDGRRGRKNGRRPGLFPALATSYRGDCGDPMPPANQQQERLRGIRVLLVEDDEDIRAMTTTVLAKAGVEVHAAGLPDQAEKRLAQAEFDAILMDWNLAGVTGGRLLEKLRDTNPRMFARSAVVTGDLLSIPGQHEAESFGRPVLAKPFRPARLIELLLEILDGADDA